MGYPIVRKLRSSEWTDVQIGCISPWEDFNFKTLIDAYGDMLRDDLRKPLKDPTPPGRSVVKIPDMNNAIQKDVFRILEAIHESYRLYTANSEPQFRCNTSARKLGSKNRPFQFWTPKGGGETKRRVRVIGVVYSQQWESKCLESPLIKEVDRLPLQQLAQCAAKADTPYGLIVTEKEVVIVRVSYIEKNTIFNVE